MEPLTGRYPRTTPRVGGGWGWDRRGTGYRARPSVPLEQVPAELGRETGRARAPAPATPLAVAAGQVEVPLELARLVLELGRAEARPFASNSERMSASESRRVCDGSRARSKRSSSSAASGSVGASWSMITSTRPPGRVTRASSATASSGRAMWWSVRVAAEVERVAVATAGPVASPSTNVTFGSSRGAGPPRAAPGRCRARPPRGRAVASANASAPVPVPSRARARPRAAARTCAPPGALRDAAPAARASRPWAKRARTLGVASLTTNWHLRDAVGQSSSASSRSRSYLQRAPRRSARAARRSRARAGARARRRGGAARPGRAARASSTAPRELGRRRGRRARRAPTARSRGGSGAAARARVVRRAARARAAPAVALAARPRSAAPRCSPKTVDQAQPGRVDERRRRRSTSSSEPPSGASRPSSSSRRKPRPETRSQLGQDPLAGRPARPARRRARTSSSVGASSGSRARPRAGPRAAAAADRPRRPCRTTARRSGARRDRARPPPGSTGSPPASGSAIALIGEVARARSSSSVPRSGVKSTVRPSGRATRQAPWRSESGKAGAVGAPRVSRAAALGLGAGDVEVDQRAARAARRGPRRRRPRPPRPRAPRASSRIGVSRRRRAPRPAAPSDAAGHELVGDRVGDPRVLLGETRPCRRSTTGVPTGSSRSSSTAKESIETVPTTRPPLAARRAPRSRSCRGGSRPRSRPARARSRSARSATKRRP